MKLLKQELSPDLIAPQVSTLRADWGYASEPNEPPTWAATAEAVEILATVRAPIPAEVLDSLTLGLMRTTTSPDAVFALRSDWQAQWSAATVAIPASVRESLIPKLSTQLNALIDEIAKTPCDGGFILSAAVELEQLGAANGINIELPHAALNECAEELRTANGQLALFPGDAPDMAVTYFGATLGFVTRSTLESSLLRTLGRDGWRMPAPTVEPDSTYWGIALAHALAIDEYDSPARNQVVEWIANVESWVAAPVEEGSDLEQFPYILMAARGVAVPVPEGFEGRFSTVLGQSSTIQWEIGNRLALLRMAAVLHVPIPKPIARSVEQDLMAGRVPLSDELTPLVILADVWSNQDFRAEVSSRVNHLSLGDSVYAYSVRTRVGFLDTTVAALYETDRLVPAGPDALATFSSDLGTWGFPPSSDSSAYIDLETFYLGYVLSGRIVVPDRLP